MNARHVLATIIMKSGKPKITVSKEMGKAYTYVNNVLSRGSVPQADTFAMIADVCGFDLLVRQRSTGDEMLIDPPAPKNNTK